MDGWNVGWKYGSSEDTRIIEHCELKRKVKVTKEYFTNTVNADFFFFFFFL